MRDSARVNFRLAGPISSISRKADRAIQSASTIVGITAPLQIGRNAIAQLGAKTVAINPQVGPSKKLLGDTEDVLPDVRSVSNNGLKYLVIQRKYQKMIKKFNVTADSIAFHFNPVNGNQNSLIWLQTAFQELLVYILKNTQPSDHMGLILRNHDKPLGISFRRVNQLSVAVIFNVNAIAEQCPFLRTGYNDVKL